MTADNPDDHPADPNEAVPPHEPAADASPPEEHAHAESAADDTEHPPADDGEAELAVAATPALPETKHWYIVKVQSGREESIRGALERRVKIEGLEEFFGGIKVPMERVTEMRNGKRVVRSRKKFPGYLMVNVEFNDRILYLFRETSGVGDFVGGSIHRPPAPMPQPIGYSVSEAISARS